MTCEFKQCRSGKPARVSVMEIVGDGAFNTFICQECCDAMELRPGQALPHDADSFNRKLKRYYDAQQAAHRDEVGPSEN